MQCGALDRILEQEKNLRGQLANYEDSLWRITVCVTVTSPILLIALCFVRC